MLLSDPEGREAVAQYLRGFLSLAGRLNAGFILDCQTGKTHPHWADDLGASISELGEANRDAIAFLEDLRFESSDNGQPIVLNGVIGPRGDAYAPEEELTASDAEAYHRTQIGWWPIRPSIW